ncbi:hypothetical protein NP493_945g00004 [Ridgeia piscesae]|uniref:Annexin n=1 Tax=Ridgeia piscesae TaxID=27915 RepID=A0AAD9KJN5_RIDPI|nr:hypothetical protein NP493_945g00004 [Ridgeia piscesae]
MLKSEMGGYLKEAVVALTMTPADYDARSIHKAISGAGTKESWLIEIFCTRSNAEIKAIAASYLSRYKTNLEESIESDTSGHFKRFLVSAIQGNRAELTPTQTEQVLQNGPACMVDRALAAEEAAELYSAGELQFGTDESVFLKVMATRNVYQLRATFEEYQKMAGCHIMEAISKEMSGDIQETFKTLVMTTLDIPTYFAYKLFDAMRGFGTKDTTLIRIVISRSEIDLANIKEAYKREFSKELSDAIKSETSGEYKRLLVAIVRY